MTRFMKIVLGSGVGLIGLFVMSTALTGCSGETSSPSEELKINGMSPGEYRDSQDVILPKRKGAKGAARPKR